MLCSEEFDLSPKLVPLKIVSLKHEFYLIQLDSTLNEFWINALRDAIFHEHVVFTPINLEYLKGHNFVTNNNRKVWFVPN